MKNFWGEKTGFHFKNCRNLTKFHNWIKSKHCQFLMILNERTEYDQMILNFDNKYWRTFEVKIGFSIKKKIAVNWKHVKEHGHNFLTWAILLSEHSIHVLMCPVFSAIIKYYYSKARRILVRFPKKLGSLFAACDNLGKFSIQTETAYYACSCLWPQDVTAMTSRTINYWFTCIIHLPTDSPK